MQKEMLEGFELSSQQKHLWLLQREEHNVAYHVWCAILIKGALEVPVLREALEKTIARHEALHMVFQNITGVDIPLQVITSPAHSLDIQEYDLSDLSNSERETKLDSLLEEQKHISFDLGKGPLISIILVTLTPMVRHLFLCLPALSADSSALRNLVQDISRLYETSYSKDVNISEEEPLQYVDFAQWQNDLLIAEEFGIERDYWRDKKLATLLTSQLPFEIRNQEFSPFSPTSISGHIPSEVLLEITSLTMRAGVSISTFFLACWQILLQRLTEQPEMLLGVGYDNRSAPEFEGASGLYAKYLPLAYPGNDSESFFTRMRQIFALMQEMRGLQEYFGWDYLRTSGNVGKFEPFFPFVFDWDDTVLHTKAADVSFEVYSHSACIDRFRLRLACVSKGTELQTQFHYDASVCTPEDVEVLLDQYYALIDQALHHPDETARVLKPLSEEMCRQLLLKASPKKAEASSIHWIQHVFEDQVANTPDLIALVTEDQQLTYAELNMRANQLAHYLLQLGVEPEVRVGLYLEPSVDLLIGLLGILKAGSAYVPLDPGAPPDRLRLLVENSQTQMIITRESQYKLLPDLNKNIILLDTHSSLIAVQSPENPHNPSVSDHLAYVLFTSGSTGEPKGVAITHANLLNYLDGITSILDLPLGASYTALSTFATDLGNTAIFPSLCSGGRLHLLSREYATDADMLTTYFRRYPIDCLKIAPSHLLALLSVPSTELIIPRRWLILGGEAVQWSIPSMVHAMAPECQILNHYGPTETTVGVVTYQIQWNQAQRGMTVPLGHPLSNTSIYLLDLDLYPVPVWESGEVYIGGAGLARGYLNRAELTAERFVPDPFRQEPGARLYRSGDRARWLSDGTLEFLGRLDSQVKVRGFRIELGEVEAVLGRYPEVQTVVVMVREEVAGEKRLVAYLVPRPGCPSPTVTSLRAYAQQQLPEYMIPSTFVVLEALPLTPNGKVDRRALPAPQAQRLALESGYMPPSTPTQELLVGIWQQVLRLERVGIHDNFFALGGDSILSIQVVSRARQVGIYLTAKQLFQQPSIAQLVTMAQVEFITNHASQGLVLGEVPLTPIQHWFFEQHLPVPHHFNQALLLQTRRRLQASWLEQAVQALLWQHDALRLRFTPTATGWQQAYVGMQTFPERLLLRVDLAFLPSGQQREAVEEMVQQMQEGLHVQHGPLFRIALFDLGPMQPQRVALVVHHLVIDGVSWRIVLEDLQRAYEQRSAQQKVVLAAKTSSYQQWAQYLQTYVQHPQIQQQQGYWRRQRERAIEQGLVPDRWQEGQSWAEARTLRCALSEPQTRALLQEVPRVYRTQITEVLVAALVMAWANWTGQAGVWVELEGHGREEQEEVGVDLTRTVGWFTTLYPVLIELEPSREPGAVLKQVKEQMRQIPQHGLGYGVLRYLGAEPGQEEHGEAVPGPMVRFNYLGQFDQVWNETALWNLASESVGSAVNGQGQRSYALDISAQVEQERLSVQWGYSPRQHSQKRVEELAEVYLEQLQAIIAHCQSAEAGGYTPSDFPLAQLNQSKLNMIADLINHIDRGRAQ